MLLSFRVANHRSLRDEQQLNLAPVFDADRPEGTDWPAVPIAAIFGANASGKTNLVDAMLYLRQMALESDREAEPGYGVTRFPFALDPDISALESWFVIDAALEGVRYTYGFGINDNGISEEWLHRYPIGRKQIVFERKNGEYRFGTTVNDELHRIESITPSSVLFLTSSARFGQIDVLPMYSWLRQMGTITNTREYYQDATQTTQWLLAEDNRRKALKLLEFADFGIVDVTAREVRSYEDLLTEPRVAPLIRPARKDDWRRLNRTRLELLFEMRGSKSNVRLTLDQQSAGTRTFLGLLPDVLRCLDTGSLIVVDELESNLHPNLAKHIVDLFQDPRTNPHAAQLVFTTHNTSLLGSNNEILKRDQIWFVEKGGQDGATALYPLSDFKPRNKENTERRYLGGGYGGVPFIDETVAIDALSSEGYADEPEGSSRE